MTEKSVTLDALKLHLTDGYPAGKIMLQKSSDGEPQVCAIMFDLDMDPYMVDFGPEKEIRIDPNVLTHIEVLQDDLMTIWDLAEASEDIWTQLQAYWSDKEGGWVGWEHLISRPIANSPNKPSQKGTAQ